LFAIYVENFLRESAAGFQSKDPRGTDGVHQHAKRRNRVIGCIDSAKWIGDGRHEIGATADRFGNENIGPGRCGQLPRRIQQGIEPATETASRDFFRGETTGTQHCGIDQAPALVISDQPHALALGGNPLSQPRYGGSLASSQKATDHDVTGFAHKESG